MMQVNNLSMWRVAVTLDVIVLEDTIVEVNNLSIAGARSPAPLRAADLVLAGRQNLLGIVRVKDAFLGRDPLGNRFAVDNFEGHLEKLRAE